MSGRLSYVSILSFFFLRGKKRSGGLMALVYENENLGTVLARVFVKSV